MGLEYDKRVKGHLMRIFKKSYEKISDLIVFFKRTYLKKL